MSIDDIEYRDNWRPLPIGYRTQAIARITHTLPEISWSKLSGRFEVKTFNIDFFLENTEILYAIGIKVIGKEDAINTLIQLCQNNNWLLYDVQQGDFTDYDKAVMSFQEYRQWLDNTQRDENII